MTHEPEGGGDAHPVVAAPRDPERAESAAPRADDLLFEVDGPGVHPHTVDTIAMLEMAASFFALVAAEAEREGAPLRFGGVVILDKCAAIACAVSDIVVGRRAAEATLKVLSGEAKAPPKGSAHVRRFRRAADRFTAAKTFRAGAGETWSAPIELPRPVGAIPPAEEVSRAGEVRSSWVSMRARPLRAGGKRHPEVLFDSVLERTDFTLSATEETARALGASLYREVELDAIVQRRDGEIIGGEVLSFRTVVDDARDPWDPWVEWYRSVSQE